MSQYTDLSKVGQVSAMVIRVEGELEECVKQARLFNAREVWYMHISTYCSDTVCIIIHHGAQRCVVLLATTVQGCVNTSQAW
jgi:hypothetical protein